MSHANGSQVLPFCYLNALQMQCLSLRIVDGFSFPTSTSSLRIVFTSTPVS